MKDKAIRCLLDVVDLPPENFAMVEDGRQKSHLSRQRKALVVILAKHANADGTRSFPSTITMAKALGVNRRTVYRLLADLRTLGFMSDGERHGFYKTRIRALNVSKMTPVTSSQGTGDILEPSPVTSSQGLVTPSQERVTKQDVTQPPLADRPENRPPTNRPPANPENGGGREEGSQEKPSTIGDEEIWQQLNSNLPKAMMGAIITLGQKAAVVKQLRTYGVKRVLAAMNDWIQNREMPVEDRRTGKWKIWLEESEAFLSKMMRTEREAAQKAAKEKRDEVAMEWHTFVACMRHGRCSFENCSSEDQALIARMPRWSDHPDYAPAVWFQVTAQERTRIIHLVRVANEEGWARWQKQKEEAEEQGLAELRAYGVGEPTAEPSNNPFLRAAAKADAAKKKDEEPPEENFDDSEETMRELFGVVPDGSGGWKNPDPAK